MAAAAPGVGGGGFTLRVPGFSYEPIQFNRAFWNTRRTLRLLWTLLTLGVLVTIIVLTVLASQHRVRFAAQPQQLAFVFSTVFTCLTVPISIYGIHMHLAHHSKPHIQRHIIRVLWMVPIYALNAWLTLILGLFCANEKFMFIPDAFRQCYEAYTIYSFYRYIVCYIEDREGLPLADVMAQQPPMKHLIPLRMPWYTAQRGWHDLYTLRPWRMGRDFLWHCETGIHNYVIVKPLTTAVTLVCVFTNTYGANTFRADVAYPYLAAADSMSQAWALYCLVLVYLQTHTVLASAAPTLKFLCVKGVVFATFWQGLLLSLLSFFHVFRGLQDTWSTSCHFKQEVVVDALQDVLICVEMLIFAVLHAVAFPSREYRDANLPRRAAAARLKHLFDVSDVYQDVTRHAETVAGTIAGRAAAAAGGVLQAAEDAMAHMAGSVKGNGGVGRGGGGGAWGAGNRAQGADLQKPLLDAEFEEGDLLDAPWLDAGQQPPRLPLPPLPSARPESRASQATSDAGMGPDLL